MITEQALLQVMAGQSDAFVGDMRTAKTLIEVSPGFIDIEVRPIIDTGVESNDTAKRTFLLLVRWHDAASH